MLQWLSNYTNGQAGFDHLPSVFVKLSRAVRDRTRQEDTLKKEIGWCTLLWAASFLLYFITTSIP